MAEVVGEERATSAVSGAIGVLGYGESQLTPAQVTAVYELLSRASGIVGRAARAAMRREEAPAPEGASIPASARVATPAGGRSAAGMRLPYAEIYALFAPCVGDEKAGELVRGAILKLRLPAHSLGKEDVLALLEELAGASGIVGVTARFAKARIILRFT